MLSLDEVLRYRNPRVLSKFATQYDFPQSEIEEIAVETHRFLWLNARLHQQHASGLTGIPSFLAVHNTMLVLDEFWHVFILHTALYDEFCRHHLGRFVHHSPASAMFQPLSVEATELQLSWLHDNAGPEVLQRWYDDFSERYSVDVLVARTRPRQWGRPCEARISE